MRSILLALIWVYQRFISPLLPGCCRFVPSCSAYGKEAITRHGALKGSILTTWRLLRCQPLCKGGYDPVPLEWPTRKPKQGATHASE